MISMKRSAPRYNAASSAETRNDARGSESGSGYQRVMSNEMRAAASAAVAAKTATATAKARAAAALRVRRRACAPSSAHAATSSSGAPTKARCDQIADGKIPRNRMAANSTCARVSSWRRGGPMARPLQARRAPPASASNAPPYAARIAPLHSQTGTGRPNRDSPRTR